MARLTVSPAWQNETDGLSEFSMPEENVYDILMAFAARYPRNSRRVVDPEGEPYFYYAVFVDGKRVPSGAWRNKISPSSVVEVLPPLVGG